MHNNGKVPFGDLGAYIEKNYRNKSLFTTIRHYLSYQRNAETAQLKDILQYIEYLRKQDLNPKTVRNHLFAVKIYYNYLQETGRRKTHPCKKLQLKDQLNTSVATEKLYTSEELEQFYQNYKSREKELQTRNKVIISLLVYQALQVTEITKLQLQDIDLEKGEIIINKEKLNSKKSWGNSRILPLKANQILLFYQYLKWRETLLENLNKESETFILTKQGNTLNPHLISNLINEEKGQRFLPLKIRQSVIANLLKEKNDLRLVQVFTGHKKSSTTERYRLTELEELQNAVNNFHPIQ